MKAFIWRWLPVAAYAAVMTWLSSQPGSGMPKWELLVHDKILHVIEYAGFAFLVCRALGGSWRARARVAAVVAIGVGFGALDELHQSFVPGRNGNDLGDLLADFTGSLVGAAAFASVIEWPLARRHLQ